MKELIEYSGHRHYLCSEVGPRGRLQRQVGGDNNGKTKGTVRVKRRRRLILLGTQSSDPQRQSHS